MQIPANIMNMLSAKAKGYIEATTKLAEGHRLVREATLEIAALDGKKSLVKAAKAGGVDMTNAVRDLQKPKVTPDMLMALLKNGPMPAKDLANKAGCATETARRLIAEAGAVRIGHGHNTVWALKAPKSRIVKRTIANKTTRRIKPKLSKKKGGKAERQLNSKPLNPEQAKKDKQRILALVTEKPGITIGGLMDKLGRSFYPVSRAIIELIKEGALREVKGKSEKGRPTTTWERVSHGA